MACYIGDSIYYPREVTPKSTGVQTAVLTHSCFLCGKKHEGLASFWILNLFTSNVCKPKNLRDLTVTFGQALKNQCCDWYLPSNSFVQFLNNSSPKALFFPKNLHAWVNLENSDSSSNKLHFQLRDLVLYRLPTDFSLVLLLLRLN